MRRLIAAVTLLALAAATAPAVAGPKPPGVYGRVVDVDGRPVRGVRVSAIRMPDYGPFGLGIFSCLFDAPPWCWRYTVTDVTDAAGRYAIPLDPDSEIGKSGERFVSVVRPHRSAGPPASVVLTLQYNRQPVTLPDLRFWAGQASVGPDTPRARVVSVVPPGPEYGVPAPVANPGILDKSALDPPFVVQSQGRDIVFTYDPVPYARPTDARTVEAGTTGVSGVVTTLLDQYLVTYRGLPQRVAGGARPVSRGMPCYVYDARDRLIRLPGCRFTDGRLGSGVDSRYLYRDPRRLSPWILFDLRKARTIDALVLRGCTEPVEVETSMDGKRFRRFEPYPAVETGLVVGEPVEARYVRVGPNFSCRTPLTEVSVFAPL